MLFIHHSSCFVYLKKKIDLSYIWRFDRLEDNFVVWQRFAEQYNEYKRIFRFPRDICISMEQLA